MTFDSGQQFDSSGTFDQPVATTTAISPIFSPTAINAPVIDTPSGVAVVVITPTSPAEIDAPFRFDQTGLVAFTTDPADRARQHILSVAFTLPGERVMRPTYGAGLQSLVFETGNEMVFLEALDRLQTVYDNADGEYTVTDVSLVPSNQQLGTWLFSVTFKLNQDAMVHEALFDASGNLVGTT